MIHKNTKDNLYVYTQFGLFLAFLIFPSFPEDKLPRSQNHFGLVLFFSGMMTCVIAALQLNHNLTAFPTPKAAAKLFTGGLYKHVRHPIYTGVILIFAGLSLYLNSITKLSIAGLIMVLLYFKSKYEENQLIEKFSDYKDYMNKSGRFLPRL